MSLVFGSGYDTSIFKALPLHVLLYLATIGSIIAGACEELTWRGYLLTRLEKLTGKTIVAVVIQAVLFGFYHGFTMYALSVMIFGLITGLIYAKSRRLIPLIIGHTRRRHPKNRSRALVSVLQVFDRITSELGYETELERVAVIKRSAVRLFGSDRET
ncbi:MAG: CPBP family intramembrane metalloprotease [Aigarchaeota archaeon]|nr:CPBP family intramembrane metalloprotease [Candidatus Wolframiiraptor gerlachensis]